MELATARRHRIAAAALVALAAVVAAGCGADEPAGAAKTTGSTAATLSVTETEFAIDPASARVKAPGTVRLSVVNRGKAPHALAVDTPEGVVQTRTLAAGASGELKVDLDDGTYTWYCPIGDHRARGMEGKVVVGSGDSATGASGGGRSGGNYGY
jgi:plastocyanin